MPKITWHKFESNRIESKPIWAIPTRTELSGCSINSAHWDITNVVFTSNLSWDAPNFTSRRFVLDRIKILWSTKISLGCALVHTIRCDAMRLNVYLAAERSPVYKSYVDFYSVALDQIMTLDNLFVGFTWFQWFPCLRLHRNIHRLFLEIIYCLNFFTFNSARHRDIIKSRISCCACYKFRWPRFNANHVYTLLCSHYLICEPKSDWAKERKIETHRKWRR